MRNIAIHNKCIDYLIEQLGLKEYKVFNVPHGRFTRDIFGMWDTMIATPDRVIFVQVTHKYELNDTIRNHGLDDRKNYILSPVYSYYVVTFIKRGRKYEFSIIPMGE
jgi:hypothetical protein